MQRRFRDVKEFTDCLTTLEKLNIEPGTRAEGRFQAELFVSRPRADVEAAPLAKIVKVVSGRNRTIGDAVRARRRGADAQVMRVPS
ncbi:hypothetical protein B1A_20679 [mine drainage metagenome]|uniref:Uncharacterized protein n=1 Tax=mine drainage metagenome TaxID=410659 RepID=T0Y8N5_9ZZZZ